MHLTKKYTFPSVAKSTSFNIVVMFRFTSKISVYVFLKKLRGNIEKDKSTSLTVILIITQTLFYI